MAQPARSPDGRTLVTAVVFADLVGYSKKSVTDQLAVKNAFRELVQGAISRIDPAARILVDTGDGAAIAFLRDPEHALYAALRLSDSATSAATAAGACAMQLRIGINLGPVRRAVDVNGRPNLIGDGINAAERVMSFAAPGESMTSRSFRDAVACLHESYAQLFEPLGARADKHGREHEVYRIGQSATAMAASAASLEPASAGRRTGPALALPSPRRLLFAGLALVSLGAILAAWLPRQQEGEAIPREMPASDPTVSGERTPPASGPAAAAPVEPAVQVVPDAVPQPATHSASPAGPAAPGPARIARPSATGRQSGEPAKPGRCASLTQRAAVGGLSATEQQTLRESCR